MGSFMKIASTFMWLFLCSGSKQAFNNRTSFIIFVINSYFSLLSYHLESYSGILWDKALWNSILYISLQLNLILLSLQESESTNCHTINQITATLPIQVNWRHHNFSKSQERNSNTDINAEFIVAVVGMQSCHLH